MDGENAVTCHVEQQMLYSPTWHVGWGLYGCAETDVLHVKHDIKIYIVCVEIIY